MKAELKRSFCVGLGLAVGLSMLTSCGKSSGGGGNGGGGGAGGDIATLTLIGPTGGEILGGSQTITWTTSDEDATGTVEIALSSDGGSTFDQILAANAPDTGSFTVNTSVAPDGAQYQVQLTPMNSDGDRGTASASTSDFTVDNTDPVVTITSPSEDDVLSGDATVTWTTTDANVSEVEIRLSLDGGNTFPTVIVSSTTDGGTHTWDSSDVANGDYKVRVRPIDAAGNVGEAAKSDFFMLANQPIVEGFAVYLDMDQDAEQNAGDHLIVAFSTDVSLNGASPSDFVLENTSDSFGDGATLSEGPLSNEVTITLGTDPVLVLSNNQSTIDVSPTMAQNAIENATTGIDACACGGTEISAGFVDSTQALGAADTRVVVFGDFDQDGDQDIMSGNSNNQTNTLWMNDGTGVFSDSGQSLGGPPTDSFALVAGDIDGDGDLDFITGNAGTQGEVVWVNNGSGVFSPTAELGGDDTRSVALGDVDGDGDLDLVSGNTNSEPNTVWLNNGSGSFSDSLQTLGAFDTKTVILVDVDGDDDLDILEGVSGGATHLWLNDATGLYTESTQTIGTASTGAIASGDVDQDGDADIVVGMAAANQLWLNDGTGTFGMSAWTFGSSSTSFVAIVDVNNDCIPEIVSSDADGNRVYWNKGAGVFSSALKFGTGVTQSLAFADVDGDGDSDASSALAGAPNEVWMSSLSFRQVNFVDSTLAQGSGSCFGLAYGDIDGDGDLDVVSSQYNTSNNEVYFNQGDGTFVPGAQSFSNYSYDFDLADIDGDGDLDLLEANVGSALAFLYFNDGTGVFTTSGQTLPGSVHRVRSGDLDGDGDIDVIFGLSGSNGCAVYLNDGSGTLTDSAQAFSSVTCYALKLTDLDQDGDLDIVYGGFTGMFVSMNDGTGQFTAGPPLSTGYSASPIGVDTGDIDGDGDVDIVFGIWSGFISASAVFLNDGVGGYVYEPNAIIAPGSNGCGATLNDLDGDGDLDLVLIQYGYGAHYYENNGCGLFTNQMTFGSNIVFQGRLFDANGDSSPDLYFGNWGNDALWFGQ